MGSLVYWEVPRSDLSLSSEAPQRGPLEVQLIGDFHQLLGEFPLGGRCVDHIVQRFHEMKAFPSAKISWLRCAQNGATASLRTQVLAWGSSKPFPKWVLKCVMQIPWNFGSLWVRSSRVWTRFIATYKPPPWNVRSPHGLQSIFVSQLHGSWSHQPMLQTLQRFLIPSCDGTRLRIWFIPTSRQTFGWNTSQLYKPYFNLYQYSCKGTIHGWWHLAKIVGLSYPLVNQPGKEPAQLFKRNRNYRWGMDIQVRWPFNFFFLHGQFPFFKAEFGIFAPRFSVFLWDFPWTKCQIHNDDHSIPHH